MSDGLLLTDCHTRCWLRAVAGSARGAAIVDPLTLPMFYKSHGFFTEEINLIGPHFKDLRRADFGTFAATIALIRVDGDVPVAGPVLKTIIGYQVLSRFLLFY